LYDKLYDQLKCLANSPIERDQKPLKLKAFLAENALQNFTRVSGVLNQSFYRGVLWYYQSW